MVEKTISMQDMRYINLFEKITKVRASHCFAYNGSLVFIVPKLVVSRAIGEDGKNIRKLNEILGKRVKVVSQVKEDRDIERFVSAVIHPTTFNSLELENGEVTISAGKQSKAAIIGRDKRRLQELQKIVHDYLGKMLKIV